MQDRFNGVSIVVPVYNTEKYLKRCIDSIIDQTFDNYEVILINDGSTDSSLDILKEYADEYDNFFLISQINMGQGAARNSGLSKAKGKYIYFMDSDDYILPDTIEFLYNACEKDELDLIIFDGDSFYDEDYKNGKKYGVNYTRKGSYNGKHVGKDLLEKMLENSEFIVSPCLYMVKKDLLDINQLRFPEGIIHEDELFTFNVFMKSQNAMYIPRKFFMRRIRKNSIMTNRNRLKSLHGYITVYNNICYEYCDEKMLAFDNATKMKLGKLHKIIFKNYDLLTRNERKEISSEVKRIKKTGKDNGFYGLKNGYLITYNYRLFKTLSDIRGLFVK
ncbi:glycosyltransferase [Proteiniclasticum ruminis]|uniref:Glycosyltransferase involved in cell wall bisynthesis n=1 Tax=Proteiniclasticum ruminis TaxID=398199 RepID=A0A1G8JPF2_9CLOT|nr:glycosyltransferase [Proteiniclasticum ruminis]SDI32887.1 Glycosyltransferase involved in cell wall bisynthesis [Proteiniclasticum ruminis]